MASGAFTYFSAIDSAGVRHLFRLRNHVRLLGKLSRCTYQSLKEFFRTTLKRPEGVPDASAAPVQNMGTLPTRVRNFAITLSDPDQGFIRPRIELYDALIKSYADEHF
jgi:hypothetical protein